jgi:CHASE1-domain containing sensor protein
MRFDLGTWANVAIAIFTAVTAVAAWRAASVAKSSAKDQTDALMTAAKANALASRISFYTEQIAPLREQIQDGKVRGSPIANQVAQVIELEKQQKHLAYWLDRQTDALKVGLRFECPGSELNNEVPRWRG